MKRAMKVVKKAVEKKNQYPKLSVVYPMFHDIELDDDTRFDMLEHIMDLAIHRGTTAHVYGAQTDDQDEYFVVSPQPLTDKKVQQAFSDWDDDAYVSGELDSGVALEEALKSASPRTRKRWKKNPPMPVPAVA